MKPKLLYEPPRAEVFELALENSCLQAVSIVEVRPAPMPWDNYDFSTDIQPMPWDE